MDEFQILGNLFIYIYAFGNFNQSNFILHSLYTFDQFKHSLRIVTSIFSPFFRTDFEQNSQSDNLKCHFFFSIIFTMLA